MPEASYQWLALAIKYSHSVNPPRRWGWGETQEQQQKEYDEVTEQNVQ